MAQPKPADQKRPAPRLYLVTPVIEDAAAFSGKLRDALGAADIAAVLLRLKDAGERDLINRVKLLAPIVQGKDVALVLDGHPDIAAKAVRRRRPSDRHRGVPGGGGGSEAREDRRMRRAEQPRRCHAGRRSGRGLRHVRRGRSGAAASVVRGDHRAGRMVGRPVPDSLRRIRRHAYGGRGVFQSRRRFRRGRRRHLGRPARRRGRRRGSCRVCSRRSTHEHRGRRRPRAPRCA